jgi:1-aminocyclopropane-1-carboxylate deaminase/D-cysteine desulfhydrase-like pyridoxal-dependent ACC family enzyme
LTSPLYGGNKVRKLEYLFADARVRGASRVVTLGAAGSHHVLATTVFGARLGFTVEAFLVPQPRTAHALDVLRADLACGARVRPVGSWAAAALRCVLVLGRDAYVIPVGGSNSLGALGYVDAAAELATQVRAGTAPEPDLLVVALGSGATAAGLAVGLEQQGLKTRVVGVAVSAPPALVGRVAFRLARACAQRVGVRWTAQRARARLCIEAGYIGGGYGVATDAGDRATSVAAKVGLILDPTYTAKAFAAAHERLERHAPGTVLYWHTLSSAPLAPLLAGGPEPDAMPPRLRALLR